MKIETIRIYSVFRDVLMFCSTISLYSILLRYPEITACQPNEYVIDYVFNEQHVAESRSYVNGTK